MVCLRSYSTPSDTRPATSRRATVKLRRSSAAPPIAIAMAISALRSWWPGRTALIAWPVRYGIATVKPIAAAARTKETTTPVRYGRRNERSRQNVRITSKRIVAGTTVTSGHVPRYSSASGVLTDDHGRGFSQGHARHRIGRGGARLPARGGADADRHAGE